ncbi:ricin-type beta-trefoil lectin domain protein [Virgisporangium aliadipatigenens]|uniref:ricin-type beta-trefoil lectin domain protein n=1 Tax=Virgisporangium aliadipatigenens TaxID=741659 RepID=UPI001944F49F|nr:ricin-type beta-trefoil lectin domain protein [Virgisporangium aliadipatigenens]
MATVIGVVATFNLVAPWAHAATADLTDDGGTLTAQSGRPDGSEGYAKLIDNNPRTKYFAGRDRGWVQYESRTAAAVNRYTITSGNDNPGRDPSAWLLEGSPDGTSWTTLDVRRDETFGGRGVTRGFLVTNTVEYRFHRLTISATNGSAELQWAEWGLWTGDGQPAAPSALTAVAGAGGTVDLTWRDNSDVDSGYPETGFEIQRSVDGGEFATVTVVGADVTSYTDPRPGSGALAYRIRAVSDGKPPSEFPGYTNVLPSDPPGERRITDLPGTVTDRFNRTGTDGAESVVDHSQYTKYLVYGTTTTWLGYTTEADATATRYTVTSANDAPDRDPRSWSLLASPDGTSWTTLDTRTDQVFATRFQTLSYPLTNTAAYRHYRLEVTANNGSPDFQLAELAIFGAAAFAPMPPPAAPDRLTAAAVSGDQIRVTWRDNTRWESAVRLERSTDGLRWDWARTLPAGSTRYNDVGLPGSTTYHYRVRAENPTGGSTFTAPATATTGPGDLPETWKEHWAEHTQQVNRVFYNDLLGVYFDADMEPSQTWLFDYTDAVWRYVRTTYDGLNGARLAAVYHKDKYFGGHPATVFDQNHDYRSVIDVGLNNWSESDSQPRDIIAHEIAHVVEFSFGGVAKSPSFPIWKDSRWADIFMYDVFRNTGRIADTERWRASLTAKRDDFPRAGTAWFTDWWEPIYDNHGRTAVLQRYLRLLAEHFSQFNGEYSRDLNWGEFVYFWSGAAGVDLRPLATYAFGWPPEWEEQFQQARELFPQVRFAACCGPLIVNDPGAQNTVPGDSVRVQLRSSLGATGRFTATGLPPGLTISAGGLISGTVTRGGTYTVTVTAIDDQNRTASRTFPWTALDHLGEILHAGGNCLDDDNSRTDNGNRIHAVGCNKTGAQRWSVAGTRYTVLGKCLTTAPGEAKPGTAVVIWDCDGSAGQQWTEPGDGTIRQVSSGLCLTKPANDDWVSVNTCDGSDTQRWRRG